MRKRVRNKFRDRKRFAATAAKTNKKNLPNSVGLYGEKL